MDQLRTEKERINIWNLLDLMTDENPRNIEEGARGTTVVIENKVFIGPGENRFHQKEFPYRIEFKNCVFDVHFSLGPSNFKNNVVFTNCVFNEGLWWRNCHFFEFFIFNKCVFFKTVNITAFECFRFHFDDCLFHDLLVLAEGKTKRSEDRGFGRMGGDLGNIKAKHILLDNNDFAWLTIYFHHIGTLEINSGSYEDRILLHRSSNPDVYSEELVEKTIDELKIKTKAKDKIGEIYVSKCEITRVAISGELNDGSLIFEDVKTANLQLEKFTNTSNLKFIRLSPLTNESKVSFIDTYLGKTQFFETDFSHFADLYIDNTHLTEILTTYTSWPRRVSTKDHNPDKLKENYRQLKVAMKKQEDSFQALVFEQEEMNAYSESLKNKKGEWEERFILWSSKVSNYFGRDWVLPLVWMIIFNLLFYVSIVFTIHWEDVENIEKQLQYMGRIVHLFNPTHQANLIHEDINKYNLALVIDFLSRIFSSYFIFQTIRAFRKYSK